MNNLKTKTEKALIVKNIKKRFDREFVKPDILWLPDIIKDFAKYLDRKIKTLEGK